MATRLRSASETRARQQRIALLAALAAARLFQSADLPRIAAVTQLHQEAAASAAVAAVEAMLAEQAVSAPAQASPVPSAFVTPTRALLRMLAEVESADQLDRLVRSVVPDAGRAATGVATVTRPALDGHVRYLRLPSCSRCVVLAGRFYRWSDGFQRHPRCDCVMVPTTEKAAAGLVADPRAALESGQVTGLSKDDLQAIRDGADLGRVVNVRRKAAGLVESGVVLSRANAPTPAAIYRVARDREHALELLARAGYIR